MKYNYYKFEYNNQVFTYYRRTRNNNGMEMYIDLSNGSKWHKSANTLLGLVPATNKEAKRLSKIV